MNPRSPSPPDTCAQDHRVAGAPDPIAPLRERLDAIYTPLETAVEELHKRRRRFAGRTPGRDWLPRICRIMPEDARSFPGILQLPITKRDDFWTLRMELASCQWLLDSPSINS